MENILGQGQTIKVTCHPERLAETSWAGTERNRIVQSPLVNCEMQGFGGNQGKSFPRKRMKTSQQSTCIKFDFKVPEPHQSPDKIRPERADAPVRVRRPKLGVRTFLRMIGSAVIL